MISFVVIAPHKMKDNLWQMKNISNPKNYNVVIIVLKDELKQKPNAKVLLLKSYDGVPRLNPAFP